MPRSSSSAVSSGPSPCKRIRQSAQPDAAPVTTPKGPKAIVRSCADGRESGHTFVADALARRGAAGGQKQPCGSCQSRGRDYVQGEVREPGCRRVASGERRRADRPGRAERSSAVLVRRELAARSAKPLTGWIIRPHEQGRSGVGGDRCAARVVDADGDEPLAPEASLPLQRDVRPLAYAELCASCFRLIFGDVRAWRTRLGEACSGSSCRFGSQRDWLTGGVIAVATSSTRLAQPSR